MGVPALLRTRIRITQHPSRRIGSINSTGVTFRGAGQVGMLPCFLARGLKEINTPMRPVEPLWLIAHATDTISTRTRLVYDEVAGILATNAAILNPDE